MAGYNGTTSFSRLADQVHRYSEEKLPRLVEELMARVGELGEPLKYKAPQTHLQRMAQSDRGHQNPGPGKAKKTIL